MISTVLHTAGGVVLVFAGVLIEKIDRRLRVHRAARELQRTGQTIMWSHTSDGNVIIRQVDPNDPDSFRRPSNCRRVDKDG